MSYLASAINPERVPRISDPKGLVRLDDFMAVLSEDHPDLYSALAAPALRPILEGIFTNSPFLSQCIAKEPQFLATIVEVGVEKALDQLYCHLRSTLPKISDTPSFMAQLRIAKRKVALLTALADLGGIWPLEKVTTALSEFADIAVDHTVAHLLHQAMGRGDIAWPEGPVSDAPLDLARHCGYFVLAMGKLGAAELNYSSDIDLICFYDLDHVDFVGRRSVQDCMVRLTRDLVRIMQERTGDGYVFRTDLRLRPDAGATPAAMSTEAAEIYYESLGLNWERSAMIKARVMAGDLEAGRQFLERLKPFIWRKNLDFAALDDIRSMKERIHEHNGHSDISVAGQDVKLGPGGIREIEFFVQSQQLTYGGRMPELRDNRTLVMLDILQKQKFIDPSTSEALAEAYRFLRQLEHRLQMVRDEQTHAMPSAPDQISAIANFMAFDDVEKFSSTMLAHLRTVRRHFLGLFPGRDDDEPEHEDTRLLLVTDEAPERSKQALKDIGFADVDQAAIIVARWASPRYRACRSERAQVLLAELLPLILRSLANTSEPDQALVRFDEFLSKLPSGVQMFSLFQSNPKLLDLLAQIIGSAPALSAMLGRSSALFDAVLDAGFFEDMPDQKSLRQSLKLALGDARDFQDILDGTRRWASERKFQVGVKTLQGSMDADEGFAAHTDIAEVTLGALYPAVYEAYSALHGVIPDSQMATIAMGSFGGMETSFTSDLDMIFVYTVPDMAQMSDGKKPLSASQYYARLSQRFINSITAQTSEGRLYEVDMRLRPSGNAGPVALSLDAFDTYQQSQAWTWEHMALTRARVIGAPPELQNQVERVIKSALCKERDRDQLLVDVAEMRVRLTTEFAVSSPWSVKYVRGGLVDIEFIAQYLQLNHAFTVPEILQPHTLTALQQLKKTSLLNEADAGDLIEALQMQSAVRGFMRQSIGSDSDPTDIASVDMQTALARTAGAETIDVLQSRLIAHQNRVLSIYTRLIKTPADAISRQSKSED
ncbi:MAG: bifunctional [glutamine synthetase] adenylyltransferase/[glutamine synthetase]-adenylyl-L-tyrosine phosphorylase [Alphaproteobacteria bacterium]|nr:MAG: bifunctional [glutamine synthetase] adenylyltransferase/[glutamine synthetase]-adenylyl-L-tyrosine phosphorylase [Alphaproteobacteria bacterium]